MEILLTAHAYHNIKFFKDEENFYPMKVFQAIIFSLNKHQRDEENSNCSEYFVKREECTSIDELIRRLEIIYFDMAYSDVLLWNKLNNQEDSEEEEEEEEGEEGEEGEVVLRERKRKGE